MGTCKHRQIKLIAVGVLLAADAWLQDHRVLIAGRWDRQMVVHSIGFIPSEVGSSTARLSRVHALQELHQSLGIGCLTTAFFRGCLLSLGASLSCLLDTLLLLGTASLSILKVNVDLEALGSDLLLVLACLARGTVSLR